MVFRWDGGKECFTGEQCFITEMAGAGNDPSCSVARARVGPGRTTRRHRLRGVVERYIILEGEGNVEVNGEPAAVSPLDVVLIPEGAAQRITNTGPGELIFLCICTPPFTADAYVDCDG
jgi:mannose-6-phosphate isomerase-like protein (cupin superfamily)